MNDDEIKECYARGVRCKADKEGDCDCNGKYRGSKPWCQLISLYDEEVKDMGEEYQRRY